MNLFHKILILLFGVVISVHAVPPVLNFAGQVAVNGEAFDGNGLFKFALVNADGTTSYWSNDGTSVDGLEPQASVAVSVNGGLYSILLGNTAQQGMGPIDPSIFAQHNDAKLRVWFSDGVNGFQQLSPDRPFASVPYAFSAGTAQTAGSAPIANGTVNLDMLSQDVKTQINAPISRSRLSQEVVADINATIGMNRLSTEVTEKLNQEKTTNNYNAPSVGSLLAVPYGSDAPAGYSLYQRGEPKELVWEEKAPVSVARNAYDGVEVLDGKIYFVGGQNGSAMNIAEKYDPISNTWVTLSPMSTNRQGIASTVLNGKVYAIGGQGVASVEVYDPSTESWSAGVALPSEVNRGTAITVNEKIYVVGGINASGQNTNQVLCFDPSSNQWSEKANMPTARFGIKLVWFENRIWAIGGSAGSPSRVVESYEPSTNAWQSEATLTSARRWSVSWVLNDRIYVGGEWGSDSIEAYNIDTNKWEIVGSLPEDKFCADAVVLNDKVYVIAGQTASGVSNKVFAADLNASVEGVYDLYRKDGDAPVGTPVVQSEYADGSVTTSKLDATILKYLKPEITSQPQAKTVYADSNTSFSVTAEGKYLTYQWKKDGVNLAGETNATLNITDANATLHDGNYSVVVSNDFGSVESGIVEIKVIDSIMNDLVAWWKFDEINGTVAYDSSGNGNDGNLVLGATWTDGIIGNAISFNTSQYMTSNVKYKPASDASGQSYSAWVKVEGNSWEVFGSNAYQDGMIHLSVQGSQNNITFNTTFHGFGNNGESSNTKTIPVTLGWHNVILIKQANKYELFFDGSSLIADMLRNTSNTSTNFNLGRKYASSNNVYYSGTIDDVRIYDRALSAEEVQALYNLGQ